MLIIYFLFRYITTMRDIGRDMVNTSGSTMMEIPEIPDATTNLKQFENSEILYHLEIDGINEAENITGYIQIIYSQKQLENYLAISKEFISSNVIDLKESIVSINNKKSYEWVYYSSKAYTRHLFYPFGENQIIIVTLNLPMSERNNGAKMEKFNTMYSNILEKMNLVKADKSHTDH